VKGPATLALLGDLMLGRTVSKLLRTRSPEWIWGDVLPVLRSADAVLANLESPITSSEDRWSGGWKTFHFRADPEVLGMLRTANVRFLALANNHILDYGARGLLDTLRHLDAAGIVHAGAGHNAAEAAAPAMLDLPSLRVGLIAATDTMREFRVSPGSPGSNFIDVHPNSRGLQAIAAAAAAMRRNGASLIVLSLHWGPNMRLRPNPRFRTFARQAIDGGVDIVHGHSAHVFQGVESYAGGVILYDTGNFIDDHWNFWNFGSYWNFPLRRDDWSFVFLVDTEDGRLRRLRLLPVRTRPWPVSLAAGKTFHQIADRMQALSALLGTSLTKTGEGLEFTAATSPRPSTPAVSAIEAE
jgi:poly-gamma-glutamate synthesis protein (capsule biosynthesis protein)